MEIDHPSGPFGTKVSCDSDIEFIAKFLLYSGLTILLIVELLLMSLIFLSYCSYHMSIIKFGKKLIFSPLRMGFYNFISR